MSGKVLVVGIGNPIRQDDGVGPYCAAFVQNLPEWENKKLVDYLIVHQLDVTHAQVFARHELIIVIDADAREGANPYRIEEIQPKPDYHPFTSHIGAIPDILSLTSEIYGSAPKAYLVAVRGLTFEIGEGLSPTGLENAEQAGFAVCKLINELFPLE